MNQELYGYTQLAQSLWILKYFTAKLLKHFYIEPTGVEIHELQK